MEDPPVGVRLDCEGAKGTVKWVGQLPPTTGVWYGVDWDDESRGKHDGSHNGIKYFSTRSTSSGSFVRPTKVNLGMTLEDGLKDKYQTDPSVEEESMKDLQRSIKARFVEVVGMDKIHKQQSELSTLRTSVLDGWFICGVGETDLSLLVPNLRDLDISNNLINSWEVVASITKQLPCLKFLNVSGSFLHLPEDPSILRESFNNIIHLVVNQMVSFTWDDLLQVASMFTNLKKIQMAHNKFSCLIPIPKEVFQFIEDIDIGVNAFTNWSQITHLGSLPLLKILNLNRCHIPLIEFPDAPPGGKTSLFPSLSYLMIADNPINCWKSVGELDKLQSLQELIITFDKNMVSSSSLEFTFARIRNLKTLNRTHCSKKEKRDYRLFYLRRFSSEYFSNGGTEDPKEDDLALNFREEHPSYFFLVKELGAPQDERKFEAKEAGRLKDMMLDLEIDFPDRPEMKPFRKGFMPTMRLSKVKMMLKKSARMNPGLRIDLSYTYIKDGEQGVIKMDDDMRDLQFYSISSGDKISVRC